MNPKQLHVTADNESFAQRIESSQALEQDLSTHAASPTRALVELTNGCNHACIFCKNSNQSRRVNYLPIDTYKNFIVQAVDLGLQEVGLYSTGEPFMSKQLPEYIKIAKSAGVKRVYLTSNGAMAELDKVKACYKAGLDSIKFSINASNAVDYKLVHGFDDFDAVVKNATDINNWRLATGIELEMLCSCVSIPAVGDIEQEHRAVFTDLFDELFYVTSGSQGGQAFELIEELGVSPHGVFGNINQPNDEASVKPCYMVWNRYHLTAEGYLSACCVDYELDLVIANLNEQTLSEGWNNETAKQLRSAHLNNNLEGLLCHQCMLNKKLPYKPISEVPKTLKPTTLREKEQIKLKDRVVYTLKLQ
jgi:pyruvate-formate lyase-activating enzyme